MKKICMSLITIIITVITVVGMYLFTSNLKNKSEIEHKNISNNEFIEKKDEINNMEKNIEEKKDFKIVKDEANDNKKEEKIQNDNKEVIKENNNTKTEKENQETVFKVNKHTLLSNLPIKDKIKLIYMCKGLSTIDMGNIKEYMKSSNEIEASSEIFKILRQRLSKEDYSEVKKILNPYVNIDYIERNI